LRSFQEEGGRAHSFTDANGKFYADVLPDSTYCVYAQDASWVSNLIDVIPFSTTTGTTVPELRIQAGQEIEILATVGPEKKPLEGVFISLRRNHEFEFLENGEVQHGNSGPQWFVKTDKNGRATTRTLAGKLEASVRSNEWNVNQEIEVVENKPTVIQFHREAEQTKIVKGKLIVESGKQVSLEGTEIRIGTIDGKYDNQQTIKADTDGTFSFSILGGKIGVFACTKDGDFAGLTITDKLDAPIEVSLKATAEYRGRLVSAATNEPLSGYRTCAIVTVGAHDFSKLSFVSRTFDALRIEDMTDEAGYFTLRGMPMGLTAKIFASSPTETRVYGERIDQIIFDSNEKPELVVKRLGQRSVKPEQQRLDAKFKQALRDCQLNNFRLMVIDYRKSEDSENFVRGSFFAHHKIPEVSNYIQILKIRSEPDNETKQDNDVDFLAAHQMKSPENGQVHVYVFDIAGTEIARIEIDTTAANASENVLKFLRDHAPPKVDAAEKWKAAFEEARQTDRKVWVRVSQRYCAPCFELSRWLDDHREVLAKDFVMLKIDDVRDPNGIDVAKRLKAQPIDGVPFHAIYDASESLLLNSSGVGGNIGFPSDSLGVNHLRKMLMSAKKNMTDAEIEKLIDSLKDRN
ncbi:MAG: thioredoxin family protein, partial [Pirellulaceae bacterium]